MGTADVTSLPSPLPLPVAALVRRARRATSPKERHDTAYFAWEASVRLGVASRPPRELTPLRVPSIGSWVSAADPPDVGGLRVESRDAIDGYRFNLEDGWWLALRFSGTEPLLRIYAEMPTTDLVESALVAGQEIAGVEL